MQRLLSTLLFAACGLATTAAFAVDQKDLLPPTERLKPASNRLMPPI